MSIVKRAWIAALAVAFVSTLALAAVVTRDSVNDKCPLSGKDIKADATSDVKVGLCCDGCKEKFDKDPAGNLAKIDKVPNEKCPVSGKKVGEASGTVTVAFCCGNCKGKFDKEPGKYTGKVKAKEKK